MIEAGHYQAKALEAELGVCGTGRKQVIVRFEIVDGPHAGETIIWFAVMAPKTENRIVRGLMECGWDGSSPNFAGITRNQVTIEVREDHDLEGNPRSKVYGVMTFGGLTEKPVEGAERDDFFGRMAAKASAIRRRAAAGNGAPKPEAADDEIPF